MMESNSGNSKFVAQDKHELITEKLLRRESERQNELDKKHLEKQSASSCTEQVGYFIKVFSDKKHEIEADFDAATCVEKIKLGDHFNKTRKDIQQLQKFVFDSTIFLPQYDIKKAQEAIQKLQQTCQELEEALLPKKKFGFASRKIKKDATNTEVVKCEDTVDSTPKPLSVLSKCKGDWCGFSEKVGENLSLSQSLICKKDVALSSLEDCVVKLYGTPSTIHMTSLKKCKIMSGPIATSVFIENCSDCVFVFPCQQVRIHSTKNTDFYLHITSRPIIEDCTQIRFAPFTWKYEDIQEHFQVAGIDIDKNNWQTVDDFNWLASDKPSPNWCMLKEEERITEWD